MSKVPVDVMRDVRGFAEKLRREARINNKKAYDLTLRAEEQSQQAGDLEDMANKWVKLFPETVE